MTIGPYRTTKEVAAELGVTTNRVAAIARNREITPLRIGGHLFWTLKQVDGMRKRAVGRPWREVQG